MRIIAGDRRGSRLEAPRGADVTRPISDRVKENLFNIIQARIPDAVVLDLFAGTGSIGLEAVSRGARWATFIEQNRDTADILRRNVEKLRYQDATRVIQGNALHLRPSVRETGLRDFPGPLVFDLVFVDPPYRMLADEITRHAIGEAIAELDHIGGLAHDALVIVRRPARPSMEYPWPNLQLVRSRTYGSMTLDFFAPAAPGQETTEA